MKRSLQRMRARGLVDRARPWTVSATARADGEGLLGPSFDLGGSIQTDTGAPHTTVAFAMWGGANLFPYYRSHHAMWLIAAGADVHLLGDAPFADIAPVARIGAAWSDAAGWCRSVCAYGIAGYRIRNALESDAVRIGAGVTAPTALLDSRGGGRGGIPLPDVLRVTVDLGGTRRPAMTSLTVGIGF